tara:strand:+ start:50 stop:328 length:279 start_codon:yes stop_codon:yes gene_type:complete
MSKKQIGGSHYKSFAIEPWTFVQENNLNPFQANVIRYACRYKNKGGIQDLEKIIHYCEMEIDFMKNKKKKNDHVTHAEVEEFAAEIAQMQDS